MFDHAPEQREQWIRVSYALVAIFLILTNPKFRITFLIYQHRSYLYIFNSYPHESSWLSPGRPRADQASVRYRASVGGGSSSWYDFNIQLTYNEMLLYYFNQLRGRCWQWRWQVYKSVTRTGSRQTWESDTKLTRQSAIYSERVYSSSIKLSCKLFRDAVPPYPPMPFVNPRLVACWGCRVSGFSQSKASISGASSSRVYNTLGKVNWLSL